MGRALISEARLVPYRSGEPPGGRWLYLAPHPDDEVLGAGATLVLGAHRRVRVRVVVVTDGAGQGDPEERRGETEAAVRVMGIDDIVFLGFADRSLTPGDAALVASLAAQIREFAPDVLFVPAPVDLHPDHRSLALAAQRAVRRVTWMGLVSSPLTWIAAYEVALPLLPNLLVDVGEAWETKRAALACHGSQLAVRRYDRVMEALGVFRSLTVTGSERVEAMHLLRARWVARNSARRWALAMGAPLGLSAEPERQRVPSRGQVVP